MVRWIQDPSHLEEAHRFFAGPFDHVRIMPFLEGIPCSIHGWVFPDTTVSFRPCEMLVFRQKDTPKFAYGGASTLWEPRPEVAHEMRSAAVRVGEYLRSRVGYRGCFTIDGVATTQGFRPTELNPRFGGAMGRMASSVPGLPLYMLHRATIENLDMDFRATELEELLVHATTTDPAVKGMFLSEGVTDISPVERPVLRGEDGVLRWAADSETAEGVIRIGPSPSGTICNVVLEAAYLPTGVSAAPYLIEGLRLAQRTWDLGIPELVAAPDVERPASPSV